MTLEDYLNLVLYLTLTEHVSRMQMMGDEDLPNVSELGLKYYPSPGIEKQSLIGRDADITELDLLASSLTQKLILLTRQAGYGKSALLRYCKRWWVATGSVEAALYLI